VRSQLLLSLSAKKASELLVPEGKVKLAQELQQEIARLIDPTRATAGAPREELAEPVTVAAAAADTQTDAAEQNPDAAAATDPAATEPADAASDAEAGASADAGPVLRVLFTSLIIQ